jgi:pimeloyl-[acyl-carrier protein] methyl ester esterase
MMLPSPSLFLPGWGLGRGPLEWVFAGTGWQIMDLPGVDHKNGHPLPSGFAAARDTLLETLPPTCHLGGWSLGGMLALAAAMKAPERVLSLVLTGCTPSFVNREGWNLGRPPETLQAFTVRIRKDGIATLPRFVDSFCRGDCDPETARFLVERASPMPQAALDSGLAWLAEADLRAAVEGAPASCPVTLIHGEHDPLMPVAAARWLAERLPRARLCVLPGKAHAPFAPDPAPFLRQCRPS